MVMIALYAKQKKRHRCTEQNFGLWEKVRVGCFERTASKHVYYLGWNRSPAQAGSMRHVLGPGALGRPRGIRWRGRWEWGSGWGIHVNPWLIQTLYFNKERLPAMQDTQVPWVWKIPWRREWQPTPAFFPGEFYGQRSLVGYSPWNCKESDTAEWVTHAHTNTHEFPVF